MACPHDLLHAPHFPGCKPDLDTARVEGGCREDVFHDAAGTFPGPLIVLLRHVHPQPWLDVFAVLTVHVLMSFPIRSSWFPGSWHVRLVYTDGFPFIYLSQVFHSEDIHNASLLD